jgi:hypothetical protein
MRWPTIYATELVTAASDMAAPDHPLADRCILHCDHGVQYTPNIPPRNMRETGRTQPAAVARTHGNMPVNRLMSAGR